MQRLEATFNALDRLHRVGIIFDRLSIPLTEDAPEVCGIGDDWALYLTTAKKTGARSDEELREVVIRFEFSIQDDASRFIVEVWNKGSVVTVQYDGFANHWTVHEMPPCKDSPAFQKIWQQATEQFQKATAEKSSAEVLEIRAFDALSAIINWFSKLPEASA